MGTESLRLEDYTRRHRISIAPRVAPIDSFGPTRDPAAPVDADRVKRYLKDAAPTLAPLVRPVSERAAAPVDDSPWGPSPLLPYFRSLGADPRLTPGFIPFPPGAPFDGYPLPVEEDEPAPAAFNPRVEQLEARP